MLSCAGGGTAARECMSLVTGDTTASPPSSHVMRAVHNADAVLNLVAGRPVSPRPSSPARSVCLCVCVGVGGVLTHIIDVVAPIIVEYFPAVH